MNFEVRIERGMKQYGEDLLGITLMVIGHSRFVPGLFVRAIKGQFVESIQFTLFLQSALGCSARVHTRHDHSCARYRFNSNPK